MYIASMGIFAVHTRHRDVFPAIEKFHRSLNLYIDIDFPSLSSCSAHTVELAYKKDLRLKDNPFTGIPIELYYSPFAHDYASKSRQSLYQDMGQTANTIFLKKFYRI